MARLKSKRIDLLPILGDSDDPGSGPRLVPLNLEILISKGKCREWPFPGRVREDIASLMQKEITPSAWMGINIATARYMVGASQFAVAPGSVDVRKVCQDLLTAINHLKQVRAKHAASPRIGQILGELISFDLLDMDHAFLTRQLKRCEDQNRVRSDSSWNAWIRNLAAVGLKHGLPVSGEGPDRTQSSKFVRMVRDLQLEMPGDWREHYLKPGSEESEAALARSIRRALADVPT
jgi:hypothetical protein